MKKLLLIIALLVSTSLGVAAQTTTVSGTVTDSDSTVWANGSWKVAFTPNPSQPNPSIYNIAGTPLSPAVVNQAGTLDGSGNFSFSVYQTAPITPAGSSWTLTVCPNATTACGVYNFTAIGSSQNLSSALTPVIPAPRFHPVSGTYGYNDAEAILQLAPGSTYFNVTTPCVRVYGGVTWSCIGSSATALTGTLTPGYYPISTGIHTLGNGTIDLDETSANTLTIQAPSGDYLNLNTNQTLGINAPLVESTNVTFFGVTSPWIHLQSLSSTQHIQIVGLAGVDVESGDPTVQSTLFIDGSTDGNPSLTEAGHIGLSVGTGSVTPYVIRMPVAPPSSGAWGLSCNNTINSYDLICSWAVFSGITQLTGDGTAGPGSGSQVLTLATVNTGPGTCGDSTHVCQITTNGKGLVTAQTPIGVTPVAGMMTDCIHATCSSGVSPQVNGTTYTNNSAVTVLEEVTYTASLSGGGTGGDSKIAALINGLNGPTNGVTNQCNGSASIIFAVPPEVTFSATTTGIDGCGGGSQTISSWLEVSLP